MAAEIRKPPKGKGAKKPIRGKLPVKRSINLILVDENKISIPKMILGIILIAALAVLFAKYMVLDRLQAMYVAESRTEQAKAELANAEALLATFGDVEADYAHYTYADMTAAETGLVDRISVLRLVRTMLPAGETTLSPEEFKSRLTAMITTQAEGGEDAQEFEEFLQDVWDLFKRIIPTGYTVQSWSVSENLLTVEVSGTSLERLNKLARELEQRSIVDTCAITNANKRKKTNVEDGETVRARLLVYLRQATEEEAEAQ